MAEYENENGNMHIGRHLGRFLHEAGFIEVKMSASYDVYSDPEGRAIMAQAFSSDYTTANVEEMEAMKKAFQVWQELPYAFYAQAECEAIGRKA